MKIKTIVCRMDAAEVFDERVNAALAEGWTLTRRRVLRPLAQPHDGTRNITMLYAELEKHDDEKGENPCKCATCRHFDDCSGYCDECHKGNKWEG